MAEPVDLEESWSNREVSTAAEPVDLDESWNGRELR